MRKTFILLLLACTLPASAAPPPALAPLPDAAPPPPTGLDIEADMEPEVKIIKRDDALVHEYRMNGQLYMIKIVPHRGYPYYLIDADGDGSLESRHSELDPGLLVPKWMIYRW